LPGKQVFEYYLTLMLQSEINHVAHLHDGTKVPVSPPSRTKTWPKQQPSEPETSNPARIDSFGPTVRGPLGWIVHARSGDKGSDANLGLWVRTTEEWDWLRSLLSVNKMKELLQGEYKEGKSIVREHSTPLVSATDCLIGPFRASKCSSGPFPAERPSRQRRKLHRLCRLPREKRRRVHQGQTC